jgi:hypothetical protein
MIVVTSRRRSVPGWRRRWVRTGKGRRTEALLGNAAVPAYDDLRELARAILAARPATGGGSEQP